MDRRALVIGVAIGAVLLLGCQSMEAGAGDEFSRQFTCPRERVESRLRPDLKAYTLIFGAPKPPAPEVAADPARMAMWQKKENESEASWNSMETVCEARGCGHESLYTCTRGKHGASCSSRDYKPGIAKW